MSFLFFPTPWHPPLTLFFIRIIIFLYLCTHIMTPFNPNMTLHKLFLNIKKRDVYYF